MSSRCCRQLLVLFTALTIALYSVDAGIETTFTFIIEPRAYDCFYEYGRSGQTLSVDFQVIAGGSLDVDFVIRSPSDVEILKLFRSSDHEFQEVIKETGDYAICFSNHMSTITSKTVFLDIGVDRMVFDSIIDTTRNPIAEDILPPGEGERAHYEVIDLAGESLSILQKSLKNIQHHQSFARYSEARSRILAESMFERVSWFSILQTIAMIVALVTQVFFIRRFFNDDKGRINF